MDGGQPDGGNTPIFALRGDPWLASWNGSRDNKDSLALYASISEGEGNSQARWSLVVARSTDSGQSFEDPVRVSSDGSLWDGPKIAITGDGTGAVVIVDRSRYVVLSDLYPEGSPHLSI